MDRVFDFNAASDGSTDIKNQEASRITYTTFISEQETADAAHPFLVLKDQGKHFPHHLYGSFKNPLRGTQFTIATPAIAAGSISGTSPETASSGSVASGETIPVEAAAFAEKEADLLLVDQRFEDLVRWLGENQVFVRLTGAAAPDGSGYGVYKIRVVDSMDFAVNPTRDSFLQLVIRRLLQSRAEEMGEEAPEEEQESEILRMTDLHAMLDYLNCAGRSLPANIRAWAKRNVTLIKTNTISPEERRHAQRALSMVLNVQWKSSYFASIDPVEARKILDEELYGLERVKQRIMETIIQINRTHTLPAYGLLLAGPAGIGKSQIAYSVARILRLPWTALDMSAIHDSEALTGSPRVYANAKAGRIMEAFSEAGSSNIVFIINELDKADSASVNGNPADALLTLLDNLGYTDNYIECMIPTSGVYPIATANDKSRISAPLMSRFAVIDIPDYTPEEKKEIFLHFSLPKVLKRMSMSPEECVVTPDAADVIIKKYRDTTGIRDLEQAAEHLAANALYQIETQHAGAVTFTKDTVAKLLDC
jgi:ATP-dependent Lon protease